MGATTEAAAAELTESEFLNLMTGMQAHYTQAGPSPGLVRLPFNLPARITALAPRPLITVTATGNDPVEPRVIAQPTVARVARPVMSSTQQATLNFIDLHRRTVTAALSRVHGPSDTAAFVREMQGLEQQEIAEQQVRIRTMYGGLIAAGQANAAARPAILIISNGAGGFLGNLLGDCHTVLHGVMAEVEQAGHAVEHAASSVAQWAGHAAQSVGKFFGSLF